MLLQLSQVVEAFTDKIHKLGKTSYSKTYKVLYMNLNQTLTQSICFEVTIIR